MTRERAVKEASKVRGIDEKEEDLMRSALLEAVESNSRILRNENDGAGDFQMCYSPRAFLALFASGNTNLPLREGWSARDQRRHLLGAIQSFSKPTARRFFAALHSVVQSVISSESYLPRSAFQDEDETESETCDGAGCAEHLQFLSYACLSVKAYVDSQVSRRQQQSKYPATAALAIINEAFQVAKALHDILLSLGSAGPDAVETQSIIVQLCEAWWSHNCEFKELVVLQAFPLLVYAATHDDAKSSVKRLYQMREAVSTIEFREESSREVQGMLLKLASSPKVLKQPEGTKLISFLMQSDPILLRGFHRAMRVQIPHVRSNVLAAFGECYFRAWKEARTLDVREAIETHALYDLMHTVIHAARPNLVKSLLEVLKPFHNEKKTPEVEALLYRLYSGMLWRSLSTTNGKIRVNATRVLARVFPLRDASSMTTEPAIRKGCDALEALLQDPDPNVRVAASEAVAEILSIYWDVLPPKEIRDFLNHIVMVQASDSTFSTVRVAAVNAVTTILDAPQSHAALRALLPLVGNLVHDRIERVRLAVVRMLLKIKGLPGIKYYHVVPVSHLTCRLAAEGTVNATGPVASSLTALMANSFCPQGPNTSQESQLTRTIKFLQSDPAAAVVFYRNLSQHVPISVVATLAANLFRCVLAAVERETKGSTSERSRRQGDSDDDSDYATSAKHQLILATDVGTMSSIMETVSTLWESIETELLKPIHKGSAQLLIQTFSGAAISEVLSYVEELPAESVNANCDENESTTFADLSDRLISALLSCARLLPADTAEELRTYMWNTLSTSSGEDLTLRNISPHVALLCTWGSTDQVAEAIASSIESSFAADFSLNFASPEAGSRKRKSSRKKDNGKTSASIELPARVALQILSCLLKGSDPTALAARAAIFSSIVACESIERALVRGTKYAERILKFEGRRSFGTSATEAELEFILTLCETLGRFKLHRDAFHSEGVENVEHTKHLVEWTSANVVPVLLSRPIDEEVPFVDLNLSRISLEKSPFGLAHSPMPTGPPRRRSNRNATPVKLGTNSSTSTSHSTPLSTQQASEAACDLAFALFHSCLILLSERSAVADLDVDGILDSIEAWTDVLQLRSEASHHKALVTAFGRLSFSLCQQHTSFALLHSLIVKSQEMDEACGVHPVGAVIAKLLALRSSKTAVSNIINCVLKGIRTLMGASDDSVNITPCRTTSLQELWPIKKGCVRSALQAVLSSRPGSLELGVQIVKALEEPLGLDDELLVFCANCLVLLCNEEIAKSAPELLPLVRSLDLGATEMPSNVRSIMEELQVGIA